VVLCRAVGVFVGFVNFIHREVLDTFPQLIEQCHRRLIALLTQWKTLAQTSGKVLTCYIVIFLSVCLSVCLS